MERLTEHEINASLIVPGATLLSLGLKVLKQSQLGPAARKTHTAYLHITMIYHFCNTAFGRTFHSLAAAYAREHAVGITTVMSREPKRGTGFEQAMIVADVNAPDFLQRIAPGDHGIATGFNQIF